MHYTLHTYIKIKICFYISDQEIIERIGYDALIFLRFHRLALRCIVKMSIFSFVVLLPLNYTGGGHANADDLNSYVKSLFLTDFLRFTMANVAGGSPRLWIHCFAAYLLTLTVIRELLVEYEAFNAIRHCYLLSRESHLRTVLVTNIPRHLRSTKKISAYFKHVYPNAVKRVVICQNLIRLEALVSQRTKILAKIERELLGLCRREKLKLFETSKFSAAEALRVFSKLEDCGIFDGSQERLSKLYTELEDLNTMVEQEQRRRRRVMKQLDRMEAGDGKKEIDYILASPYVVDVDDPVARRVLHLNMNNKSTTKTNVEIDGGNDEEDEHENNNVEVEGDGTINVNTPTNIANTLRSRSPFATENKNITGGLDEPLTSSSSTNDKQKGPKESIVKAKAAIRRYSRLARDVSFLGRPIRSSTSRNGATEHIEDHVNEVTDKAFVVMNTFTAATIALQSMHSSKPGAMQVAPAPEPRDVLWKNIYVSKGALRTRTILGEFLVILIISFYIVPVALISLLVSESALVSISPRLDQLDRASPFFSSAIAMVQPICIVTLQQLLPVLFMGIGQAEGLVSFSDVQMRAFSRYFLFQVLNVFLVTTIAGSIFDTIAIIVDNPEKAFEMLGNSLPRMSSFFITFVTIKTFIGLGLELVRTWSLMQAVFRFFLVRNQTLRSLRNIVMGMRSIDDPGWFAFHKILAQDLLVVVIAVVFAVVAPLVLFPCALFCLFSRIIWTHHHLYVYESVFESGGQFWPKIFRRFIFGLIIAQMTITGQFILKEARHEAYATIALMFMTYLFLRSTRARYDPTSSTLPLEVATVMDIALEQEEEARAKRKAKDAEPYEVRPPMATARSHEYADHQTQTTASFGDGGLNEPDPDLGTDIGGYDPFELAYVQPSLRANPHARPEQPFPPAQLGSEEALFGKNPPNQPSRPPVTGEGENCSDMLDSGATVRLKSLNREDRRLLNRWWNDQLQRAGPQNVFAVLTGEECGTLTISRRTNLTETTPLPVYSHHII